MDKNKGIALAIVIVIVAAGAVYVLVDNTGNNNSGSISVTQYDGKVVTFDSVPDRIVCLSTYAAEIIILYGAEDRVVGISSSVATNAELAPYFADAVNVGSFSSPTTELIISADPQAVITYSSSNDAIIESLSGTSIKCVAAECSSMAKMTVEATAIGVLVGQSEMAKTYCDFFENIVDTVTDAVKGKTGPTVYMESFSTWSATGSSSAYSLVLDAVGGTNCFPGGGTVSADSVTSMNPEYIIKTPTKVSMTNKGSGSTIAGAEIYYDEIMGQAGLASVDAIINDNVYIICSQLVGGPRCFAGVVAMYNIFYGDLPSGTDVYDVLLDYNETFDVDFSYADMVYPLL
ncbi:MAG: ABC transporter substrate-binding protein [Candidatus Methanomethylophilaceae archaeon]